MARGPTARLFVAVDPPSGVREELLAWGRRAASAGARQRAQGSRGCGEIRLLESEALHVTLCFLGSRAVDEIELICATVAGCAQKVGELSLGAPLWLPPRRPGVLAVEVHDRGGGLAALQKELSAALADATGWQPERRRFKGHITVARVRGSGRTRRRGPRRGAPGHRGLAGAAQADAAGSTALPATPQLSFTPSAVVLYRSWLSPAGASYEPLASCSIRADGLEQPYAADEHAGDAPRARGERQTRVR